MRPIRFGLTLGVALLAAAAAGAVEVTQRNNATALWFDGGQELQNATLMITGPDGFSTLIDGSVGLPSFRLQTAGRLSDGLYKYVLTAATNERVALDNSLDNGRGDNARDYAFKPFSISGAFRISRGAIVMEDESGGGSDQDQE